MHVIGWLASSESAAARPLAAAVRKAGRAFSNVFRRARESREIAVSAVSGEWLAEHGADSGKHHNDGDAG